MKPMFSYFGAKWRLSKCLPAPREGLTIVEPFAGSACYSLRYGANREVLLVDKNPVIVEIWNYLIEASPDEILSLPDIEPGRHIDSYNLSAAARNLIGFWLNKGVVSPRNFLSSWAVSGRQSYQYWGPEIRTRIAQQIPLIRQWKCICGDYTFGDIGEASYHIDPPYTEAGKHYPCSSADLDYPKLADWSKRLSGEVHVCENTGADWLPFEPLIDTKGTSKTSKEVIWSTGYQQRTLQLGKKQASGQKLFMAVFYEVENVLVFSAASTCAAREIFQREALAISPAAAHLYSMPGKIDDLEMLHPVSAIADFEVLF